MAVVGNPGQAEWPGGTRVFPGDCGLRIQAPVIGNVCFQLEIRGQIRAIGSQEVLDPAVSFEITLKPIENSGCMGRFLVYTQPFYGIFQEPLALVIELRIDSCGGIRFTA